MYITLEYEPDCKCMPHNPVVWRTSLEAVVVACGNCGRNYKIRMVVNQTTDVGIEEKSHDHYITQP